MPLKNGQFIDFDVWGTRGSRSLVPPRSEIGNLTSCYSLSDGEQVFVFDAGRGLAAFSHALMTDRRFQNVKSIHILITHAHMDHWEGLKDADWFWNRGNGYDLTIYGRSEAQKAILSAYEHPSYVQLDILAMGTVAKLERVEIQLREPQKIGSWKLEAFPLNHYSGAGDYKRFLDAAGFQATIPGGPVVAYLCDHEPTTGTLAAEEEIVRSSDLVVFDASYAAVKDQAYGHGSQEHAANMARRHGKTMVLGSHHGATLPDAKILEAQKEFGRGVRNYKLAVEGNYFRWDARKKAFGPVRKRKIPKI